MIKLNSINYTFYKSLMKDMLYNKDLYDFIKGTKVNRMINLMLINKR